MNALLGPWMSTDEAVSYLALPSRKALYQAVRRGQVPVYRRGPRRMRFSRVELDEILRRSSRRTVDFLDPAASLHGRDARLPKERR